MPIIREFRNFLAGFSGFVLGLILAAIVYAPLMYYYNEIIDNTSFYIGLQVTLILLTIISFLVSRWFWRKRTIFNKNIARGIMVVTLVPWLNETGMLFSMLTSY